MLANDPGEAEAAWTRFDPLHRSAARLMNVQLAALLVAVIAGAAATASPRTTRKAVES